MNGLPRQLDSLQASYDRRVEETLADADLSQEYKAQLVARLYDEAREKAQKLIDAERDRLEAELRATRRAVFEPDLGGTETARPCGPRTASVSSTLRSSRAPMRPGRPWRRPS